MISDSQQEGEEHGIHQHIRYIDRIVAHRSRNMGHRRFMWGGSDEKEAIQTIHAAFDEGINLIDTAPAYGFGQSEEIVGKAVQQYGERDRVILATKSGLDWKQEQLYRDGSRERIIKEVDDSLKRLNTDYIDLYQVHWPDPLVLIEETAEAMKDLYDAGKIRAVASAIFPGADGHIQSCGAASYRTAAVQHV